MVLLLVGVVSPSLVVLPVVVLKQKNNIHITKHFFKDHSIREVGNQIANFLFFQELIMFYYSNLISIHTP